MNNLRNALDKIIIGICVILFMFMTVVGTYQITSRYVLKDPSTISEELISYSFAWMSMFAASYVFGKRDHMRMVFFVERYSKKVQLNIAILSEIVVLLVPFVVNSSKAVLYSASSFFFLFDSNLPIKKTSLYLMVAIY